MPVRNSIVHTASKKLIDRSKIFKYGILLLGIMTAMLAMHVLIMEMLLK